DFVTADRIDQIIGAHQLEQLPHVHLRHHHLLELAQLVREVVRQWIEISHMDMRNAPAFAPQLLDRLANRAVGRAPPSRRRWRRRRFAWQESRARYRRFSAHASAPSARYWRASS